MAKEFLCTSSEPVVSTKYGKLRGFRLGEIYHFYGIKYADAKRFRMPKEVEPWDGIKDALSYGYVCPLLDNESPNGDLMVPHRFWPKDENCQYLNIWTPSLDKGAKKAVMVWIHGGAFSTGSSLEMVAYDGNNLAEYEDVVVVSLNHRLNILGYLDLSAFGEEYQNSGNAGIADLVAALQWVKDNIASFGGDPDNVTIFGQSGGGGKVTVLMQTPAAEGLFQKAIIQSGVLLKPLEQTAEDCTALAKEMIQYLGGDSPKVLEEVSYETLANAFHAVAPKLAKEGIPVGKWGPVANGYYSGVPLDVGFSDFAKSIPLMVGSVVAELGFMPMPKNKDGIPVSERKAILEKQLGKETDAMIDLFKKAYPDKNELNLIPLDSLVRVPTLAMMDLRAKVSSVPAYCFMLALDFPYDDGKPAWHCAEIPFVFHNIDKVPICNKGEIGKRLEEEMAGAWAAFAKTGNPSTETLVWKPYTTEEPVTMVFDDVTEMKVDYDRELVNRHRDLFPNVMFGGGKKD